MPLNFFIDPDEENKLIIGENSSMKKQYNIMKKREKEEIFFPIRDLDGYLKRSYKIVNDNT
jgi:hypothetical protein